ncbi:MAG: trehalose-6-phosphate synthase, partial [Ramlibacter sp.]
MMRTIRLQLRFLLPLVVILTAAAYLALPLMDRLTLRWFARDLTLRGELVANALSESVADALQDTRGRKLQALFDRALQDERMVAIGWCSTGGQLLRRTQSYPKDLTCDKAAATAAEKDPSLRIEGGPVHVTVHAITAEAGPMGQLVLLHDLSFIERRSQDTRQYLIVLIASLGAVIALVTVIVAQLSWRGWVSGARALLRGEGLVKPMLPASPELAPLAAELRDRLRELEDEYRRVQGPETGWNAQRLQSLLRTQLRGDQVIVVSNREPYIHERKDGQVVVRRP